MSEGGIKIRASVPAKAILFGEHFVVYGKRALATALNLRLNVEVSDRVGSEGGYHLIVENIPSFGLQMDLRGVDTDADADAQPHPQPFLNYGEASRAIAYIRCAIQYMERRYGHRVEGGGGGGRGVEIRVSSEIPLSAGLGSSAAVSVATIAALKRYFGLWNGDLEELRADAHRVEEAVQGKASPTDTAISTYGGYVVIEGGEVKRLHDLPEIELVTGSITTIPLGAGAEHLSELRLKTRKLVEAVKARKEAFSSVFEYIASAADVLTVEAIEALRRHDLARVGSLMNINHGLLDAIGVVPRELSELVKLAQDAGALGAKVTGAGGLPELGGTGTVIALPAEGQSAKLETVMGLTGASVRNLRTKARGLVVDVEENRCS